MNLFNILFNYVIATSKKYNIDESHSLKHSMDILHFANNIYESELPRNPYLEEQKNIIFTSAIIHDMCDKKYRNEKEGVEEIKELLDVSVSGSLNEVEISKIIEIISTMSYSKVKMNGFPDLGDYQLSYHIVREADLLTAYDFERTVIFQMMRNGDNYMNSFQLSKKLFDNRVLKYRDDGLFLTHYSKCKSLQLHNNAIKYIKQLENRIMK
jgi:hypothetical protein